MQGYIHKERKPKGNKFVVCRIALSGFDGSFEIIDTVHDPFVTNVFCKLIWIAEKSKRKVMSMDNAKRKGLTNHKEESKRNHE